jgi:hypothetical protein
VFDPVTFVCGISIRKAAGPGKSQALSMKETLRKMISGTIQERV